MAIEGELEDIGLPDLIQTIAQTQRSGRLKLTSPAGDGAIVFRQGKIIYAASSSARETLGSLLLCRGLLSEIQLVEALDRQARATTERRLGAILVEMGAVREKAVEEVVFEQTTRVISEFIAWSSGRFRFDRMDIRDHGEVELDAHDFFVDDGLGTEHVLLETAKRLDEMERNEQIESVDDAAVSGEAKQPAAVSSGQTPLSTIGSLKSVIGELRSPAFTGEISKKILGFTEQLFERSALFLSRRDGFQLMTASGEPQVDGKPSDSQIVLPADEPSLLSEAARTKELIEAPLGRFLGDLRIVKALASRLKTEAVAAPLIVNDRVLLVVYGDSRRLGVGPRWRDELELLLLQAGVSMEKALLNKRIEYYEHLQRARQAAEAPTSASADSELTSTPS